MDSCGDNIGCKALIVARRRLRSVWTLPLGGMLVVFCGLRGADMSYNRLPEVTDDFPVARAMERREVLEISENDRGVHMNLRVGRHDRCGRRLCLCILCMVWPMAGSGDIVRFSVVRSDRPSNDKVAKE